MLTYQISWIILRGSIQLLNRGTSRARELIEELNHTANRIDMIDPNITENDLVIIRKVVTVKIDKWANELGYDNTNLIAIIQRLKDTIKKGKYDDKLHLEAGEIFSNFTLVNACARSRKTCTNT